MKRSILCTILMVTLVSLVTLAGCSSDKLSDDKATAPASSSSEVQPAPEAAEVAAEVADEGSSDESAQLPESNWTVVLDSQISHPTNIAGYLNENFGITVGFAGEIHYSNDGGQTWPRSENSSMCRFCLDIVDENLAWCGGNGNSVRVTNDGGKTWKAVTDANLDGGHANIDFVDATNGWIASQKKCAVTTDGGTTWTMLTLPEDVKSIAAICLRTTNDAYLMTHNGLFFKTGDGGATWNKYDLKIEDYEVYDSKSNPGLAKNNVAVADISFSDENNGLIVFTGMTPGKGNNAWCLTTTDGGTTWVPEKFAPAEGFSPTKVFISGDCKYITMGSYGNQHITMKHKD